VTDDSAMLVNEEQPLNADASIEVTDDGKSMFANE
jgi:hypothetical protein